MSPDLTPGMIIQLGNGGPGMDSYGVESTRPYTGAEFEVIAGEGQCGTGPHSKSKRKISELSGVAEDVEEEQGDIRGRLSVAAVEMSFRAQARRQRARERSGERYAEAQRQTGSKSPNQKFQTHDKRRMVFVVHNTAGKGKIVGGGRGTFGKGGKGKGRGKGTFGKGGKGKGKGRGKGGKGGKY